MIWGTLQPFPELFHKYEYIPEVKLQMGTFMMMTNESRNPRFLRWRTSKKPTDGSNSTIIVNVKKHFNYEIKWILGSLFRQSHDLREEVDLKTQQAVLPKSDFSFWPIWSKLKNSSTTRRTPKFILYRPHDFSNQHQEWTPPSLDACWLSCLSICFSRKLYAKTFP